VRISRCYKKKQEVLEKDGVQGAKGRSGEVEKWRRGEGEKRMCECESGSVPRTDKSCNQWSCPSVDKILTIIRWNEVLVFNFNTQESTIVRTQPEIFINFMAQVK